MDFPCQGTLVFPPWRGASSAHNGGQPKLWLQVGRTLKSTIVCLLVGRSVERDLETQMVVVTSNEGLRDRLQQERDALFKFGTPVTAQVLLFGLKTRLQKCKSVADLGGTRESSALVGC